MNQKVDIQTVSNYPVAYWHFEVSSKCTLKCPRCPRTEKKGMYKVTEHTLEFVQSILTPEVLATTPNILFCGGQGDPIYCHDFLDIVRYVKTTNPKIQVVITTNGSHKKTSWWEELAHILNEYDTLTFSVDGWDNDSNNIYRVNSDFNSITSGIAAVRKVNNRVPIHWSTILFKFNQDKIKEIASIAKDLGVTNFILVRSTLFGSNNPHYIDTKLGYDPLEPASISSWAYHEMEQNISLNTSYKLHNHIGSVITNNMLKTQEEYKESPVIPLCVSGDRGLYVDAEGILYPCSWISHPFGTRMSKDRPKTIKWEKSLFVEHKSEFDLHLHSLADILSGKYWLGLMESWRDPNKMFVECESKCNNKSSCNRISKRLNHRSSVLTYEDFIKNIG